MIVCFTISAEFDPHPDYRPAQHSQERLQASTHSIGFAANDDALGLDEGGNGPTEPEVLGGIREAEVAPRMFAHEDIAQLSGGPDRQLRGHKHHGAGAQQWQERRRARDDRVDIGPIVVVYWRVVSDPEDVQVGERAWQLGGEAEAAGGKAGRDQVVESRLGQGGAARREPGDNCRIVDPDDL